MEFGVWRVWAASRLILKRVNRPAGFARRPSANNRNEHEEHAAMTFTDIEAAVTGERMMSKQTDGRERPTHDKIASLAYHFYEAHGRQDGRDVDDWLSAEREIRQAVDGRDVADQIAQASCK